MVIPPVRHHRERHLLPVEVCRGERTSEATVQATCEVARRAGRQPIRVERDVPGFLVNRLQLALLWEAFHIVEEGIASPDDIDRAMQSGLGLRWAAVGPFRVVDLAGLGTFRAVAARLFPELSASTEPPAALVDKVDRGRSAPQPVRASTRIHPAPTRPSSPAATPASCGCGER